MTRLDAIGLVGSACHGVIDVDEVNQSAAEHVTKHPEAVGGYSKFVIEYPETVAEYPEAIVEYPAFIVEHQKAIAEYPEVVLTMSMEP